MREGGPLFCDITWHPAGNPGGDSETSSLTIATASLNYCGLDTVLHMTCTEQSFADISRNLQRAKDVGIRTILALRGGKLNLLIEDRCVHVHDSLMRTSKTKDELMRMK